MRKSKMVEKLTKKSSVAQPPHLIVEARAGTGKTTTLLQGLRVVFGQEPTLTPSVQQQAIWDCMALSKGQVRSCAFVAFSKPIADELKTKVPAGVDAMTNHGMGFRAIMKSFGKVSVDQFRVDGIISNLLGYGDDTRTCRAKQGPLVTVVKELVGLCKMNLVGINRQGEMVDPTHTEWETDLDQLVMHYGIEMECDRETAFGLVPKVLEKCKDVDSDRKIDFDDMIWLPIILDLPCTKYDLLLVDEFQDTNLCQQELVKKCGKRLICVGDTKQAIYGFAGADAMAMSRFKAHLSSTPEGCTVLGLTVTRRCGKAIVEEARKIVSDFSAHESNGEGKVRTAPFLQGSSSYHTTVQGGDMVISRVNGPLVSECFKFIRAGKKANIIGRDIGKGLVRLVEKLGKNSCTVEKLIPAISAWQDDEVRKETAKKNPSDTRIMGIGDKADCLLCFAGQCKATDGIGEVVRKIESVFTDDRSGYGIRLSSIHKAKGLEAGVVYFINNKEAPCPHPMAKSDWERGQEQNLLYVGVTRAISELVWVK